jgi:hypothetical protein
LKHEKVIGPVGELGTDQVQNSLNCSGRQHTLSAACISLIHDQNNQLSTVQTNFEQTVHSQSFFVMFRPGSQSPPPSFRRVINKVNN